MATVLASSPGSIDWLGRWVVCVGVGERQVGVSVFGGDWGVEPCGALGGEAFAFGVGE